MTKVTIWRNNLGNIFGFCADGHSDDSAQCGEDIYCAAISAILQTAVLGLTEYIKADIKLEITDGWLFCEMKDTAFPQLETCRAILETMLLGLSSFKAEYSEFIEINEEVR